jgi:hypothetical protein
MPFVVIFSLKPADGSGFCLVVAILTAPEGVTGFQDWRVPSWFRSVTATSTKLKTLHQRTTIILRERHV